MGKDKGYDYTRASNPTRALLEQHLAEIEGAKFGVCFSSGMSAVDSVLKIVINRWKTIASYNEFFWFNYCKNQIQ